MSIRFDDRVAIVTGGGNGLGRRHCLTLAERGAKVVVNDLGGSLDGHGDSVTAADAVVEEIRRAGGDALANNADVTKLCEVESMVEETLGAWGRVDILINNAGILRDKSFTKMDMDDFKKVVDVHLFGSTNCTKAVWDIMRDQNFGRILLTSSVSGIFGSYGQANYGAAKAAMVGLMNVLHLEGAKNGIRVNALAPNGATRMLDGILPDEMKELLPTRVVSAGALYLVSDDAPSRTILSAGAGSFAVSRIFETDGVYLGHEASVDDVAENWNRITDETKMIAHTKGGDQFTKCLQTAARELGIDLNRTN